MASRTFIRGTVKYAAELAGLLLPETSFLMSPPVKDVVVKCDGEAAEIAVTLGAFSSEAEGRSAAAAAMRRVWGALLVGVPHAFTSVTPPSERASSFEAKPEQPNSLAVACAEAVTLGETITCRMTPAAHEIDRVRSIAVAPRWSPGTSIVFERFERALGESDAVAQFLALYETANLAIEVLLGRDAGLSQETFDRELRKLDPSLPVLAEEGLSKPNETPFMRARNQLVHPRGRGVTWQAARAYTGGQVQPFRMLVARLIALEAAQQSK